MPRPTRVPDAFATDAGTRVAPTAGRLARGYEAGVPVPPLTHNDQWGLNTDWIRYLAEVSPADGVLDFRAWRCPDDAAFTVEWDGPSGTDGLLEATLSALGVTVASGGGITLTSTGMSLGRGGYDIAFSYDYATKTVTGGNPPVSETVFWQRALTTWSPSSNLTITQESVGATVYQSASVGASGSAVSHMPAWDNPAGEPSGGVATALVLTDCTIRLRQLTESGGGSPDATISVQWYDRTRGPAAWVTAASVNITTAQTLVGGGVDVTVPAVTTAADATILRGAPMRVLVELAAITGETQTCDILYTTIRGIKTRAE